MGLQRKGAERKGQPRNGRVHRRFVTTEKMGSNRSLAGLCLWRTSPRRHKAQERQRTRLVEKLAGETRARLADLPPCWACLSCPSLWHLQAQPLTLLKRKWQNRTKQEHNRNSFQIPNRRKPQPAFWKLEQKLPPCLQWLVLSTWPCALQLALRAGHIPNSFGIPPLALGPMPGLPQAAKHVPGPKEQNRRPLAQLRQPGKDRKKVTPCSRDKKAQRTGLAIHSQCSLSFKLSPVFSMGYLGYHHSNPLWLIILQMSPASFQLVGSSSQAGNSLQLLCAWLLYYISAVSCFMVNIAFSSDTWHADFQGFWRVLFNCEPPWDTWNRVDFSPIQFIFKFFSTQLLGEWGTLEFLFDL